MMHQSANRKIIRDIGLLAGDGIPFLLIVDFEMATPLLYPVPELPDDIFFQTTSYEMNTGSTMETGSFEFEKCPVAFEDYQSAFDLVIKNTMAGNTFLTNLTFPTEIHTSLDLRTIYQISRARYKLLYRDEFVVFSPETFVQVKNGRIFSYPMKGTIDAAIPDASRIILEDEKEMAEHITIVDLIRNDLSMHARQVKVDRLRYIDTLKTHDKTLLQVSSVISGTLPDGYASNLGEILFSMLPAGSVSGAPKAETLRIIREAEGGPRGFYTGIMGYFDGRDFDSGVMIRYIEKRNGAMYYRSGGGITFMSDPRKEYQELIDKIYVPVT